MAQPVQLIPLICVKCETPVRANPEETAWACTRCGQGLVLDETHGLRPLEIHYAASLPPGQPGHPFWVADGSVSLQRTTYKGNQNREAEQFWSQPRRFFVPASAAKNTNDAQIGVQLLLNPVTLQDGPPAPFEPVTLGRENVTAAAEFIVVAIEAGRKDQMKTIHFKLQLAEPQLWILP